MITTRLAELAGSGLGWLTLPCPARWVMADLGTARSLTRRFAMVRTLALLRLRLMGSSIAGLPLALSGPTYDVHPSSAKVAWAARAAVMHGVRSCSACPALISLGVSTMK